MSFLTGILGGGKSKTTAPAAVSGLQLQSSNYGAPIQLVYGTTRIPPNLIWYGDFVAIPQSSSGGSAGKGGIGGGGGGKGGNPTSYVYQVAFQLGLCEGPIQGINNVYIDKNIYNLAELGMTLFTGTYPQSPWSYLVTNHSGEISEQHTVPATGPYTVTVNGSSVFLADAGVIGPPDISQFTNVTGSGSPAHGQYTITTNLKSATYHFNSADVGLQIVIEYVANYGALQSLTTTIPSGLTVAIANPAGTFADHGVTATNVQYTPTGGAPAAEQYSVSAGTYTFNSANAGAVVTINYVPFGSADQALDYNGIAHVDAAAYALGNGAQLPNHNFEVQGVYANSVAQEIIGEQDTIPASPYEIAVQFYANFLADQGVVDSNGIVYTAVGSSPSINQYSVSGGLYTFNAGNVGTLVNISYTASVGPDADPSLVIADLLSNAHYGAGFPSARVGAFTTYQQYCIASGLLVSPNYNQQASASTILDDLATATNSAFVWSSGVLTLVPYGDTAITANGYTYTPPSSPLYNLGDDDFMKNDNSTLSSSGTVNTDPVLLVKQRPADQINSIKLEVLDRANAYNPAVIEAKDQAMIDVFGLRQNGTKQSHLFANIYAAKLSAQLQLQRQAIRNLYSFQLDQRYIVLDPMDIVSITDANLGLSQQWVRIIEITENDDNSLTFSAEEYLQGTGSAPLHSFQINNGFDTNYNAAPATTNTPIIFEPPVQITAAADLETWVVASGQSNWGGCDVWISTDGDTYKLAGRITGPARQGVSTAIFPSGTDPDTTDTLSVDLTQSGGQLTTGTQNDADLGHTLCYIDGELIAYETATLTGTSQYDLGTYIRRGMYGTTIASHANGTQFARLDDGIFTYPYDKSQIGLTIYVKLAAFNIYGGGQESLANLPAYTHVIAGPPLPAAVQNFSGQQQGNAVVLAWDDLAPSDVGLKGYDIGYAEQGTTNWSDFTLLTEAARTTEVTTVAVPPGTWTIGIRAHDIADQLGPISTFNLTVTNPNAVILSAPQELPWLGNTINPGDFVVHYTGLLIPNNLFNANEWSPSLVPDAPTLSQVAGGSITGATYFVKVTWVTESGETTASTESHLAVTTGNLLVVNAATYSGNPIDDQGNAIGWNLYIGTSSGSEQLQNPSPLTLGINWTMPTTGLITGVTPPTNNQTGWETFNIFVPAPISFVEYFTPDYDTGLNASVRVFLTYNAIPGPGQTGQPTSIETAIDTWLTGQSDPVVYTPWTIGNLTMRYINAELAYTTFDPSTQNAVNPGNICYFSDFIITVDTAPVIENSSSGGIAVAALITTTGTTNGTTTVSAIGSLTGVNPGMAIIGSNIPAGTTVISVGASSVVMSTAATGSASGETIQFATWVTFPEAYHQLPNVVVTPVSIAAASGSATNITTQGFTPLIWSGASSIAGTANWQSTGE